LKENKYIEKFKLKTKSELEYKIENPSLFGDEALEAAKIVLQNYDLNKDSKAKNKKLDSSEKAEAIFKDKAFFKQKWIYIIALLYTALATVISFFAINYLTNYDYAIWGIINLAAFIVLIIKHPKTLYFLKALSIMALIFILYRYISTYLNLTENETIAFQTKDIKYILICFILIFGGEQIIEVRKVQTNK
jgi:hypothetical protein